MSYCANLNITFVHIAKTGGTSINQILRRQSFRESPLGFVSDKLISRLPLPGKRGFPGLSKHALAIDYHALRPDLFANSFSFAFVRNPWDWLVSWYSFVKHSRRSPDRRGAWKHALFPLIEPLDFEGYIHWVTVEHGLRLLPSRVRSQFADQLPVLQSDWLVGHDDKPLVNYVGRFESLEADLGTALAGRLSGARDGIKLPLLNRSTRQNYRDYYSQETRVMVARYFEKDIDSFGYLF